MAYNVAVDVGGTFTDVLVFDEQSGELTEGKVLSTPEDPSQGVVTGIETTCEKVGISFEDLNLLFPRNNRGDEHDPHQHWLAGRPPHHEGTRADPTLGPRLDAGAALRLDGASETRPAR